MQVFNYTTYKIMLLQCTQVQYCIMYYRIHKYSVISFPVLSFPYCLLSHCKTITASSTSVTTSHPSSSSTHELSPENKKLSNCNESYMHQTSSSIVHYEQEYQLSLNSPLCRNHLQYLNTLIKIG